MAEVIADVLVKLLSEAGKGKSENGKIPDEVLSGLHCIFQNTLVSALDLVDRKHIVKMTSDSGRSFYEVKGMSGVPYLCLEAAQYCSCPSFLYSVLMKQDMLMCKHLLAMKLSKAFGEIEERNITDNDYILHISEAEMPI